MGLETILLNKIIPTEIDRTLRFPLLRDQELKLSQDIPPPDTRLLSTSQAARWQLLVSAHLPGPLQQPQLLGGAPRPQYLGGSCSQKRTLRTQSHHLPSPAKLATLGRWEELVSRPSCLPGLCPVADVMEGMRGTHSQTPAGQRGPVCAAPASVVELRIRRKGRCNCRPRNAYHPFALGEGAGGWEKLDLESSSINAAFT